MREEGVRKKGGKKGGREGLKLTGSSFPIKRFRNVDFPTPFGPTTATERRG